jgi:hypothetical protein
MWNIFVLFIKEIFFIYDERPASIFRVDGSNFFLSDDELLPGIISYPARHFFHKKGTLPKDDSAWRKHKII